MSRFTTGPGKFGDQILKDRAPDSAITTGIAQGENNTKVGVYGHSVSNAGVYGSSDQEVGVYGSGGQFAGFFEGDVSITGKLTLDGTDLGARVAALEALVQTLSNRLAGLQPVVDVPLPSISYANLSDARAPQGELTIAIELTGFAPNSTVAVRVVNQADFSSKATFSTDATGSTVGNNYFHIPQGTQGPLYLAATDGRPNPHDLTGLLWSNTVKLTL